MIKKKLLLFMASSLIMVSPLVSGTSSKALSLTYNPSTLNENTLTKLIGTDLDQKILYYTNPKFFEEFNKPYIVRYIVSEGDTIESISKNFMLTPKSIIVSNKLDENSQLKAGQELFFPSIDGIIYEVKKEDNLWSIANDYNLSPESIIRDNKANTDILSIGEKLILKGVTEIKVKDAPNDISVKSTSNEIKTKKADSDNISNNTYKKVTSTKDTSSNFVWPASGDITSKFGSRWGSKHTGIDIAVETGTSVKAAAAGKVIFSGRKGNYGNLIIIDHGNGYKTYYAHNSRLLAEVGQSVDKGTIISLSGSTGNSTGPHLHFEIRQNDEPVNPLSFLK